MPAAYETYKALAQAAIAEYGGRYLVRGGAAEILEGKWVNVAASGYRRVRVHRAGQALLPFASLSGCAQTRLNAAEMNMLVVAGVDNLV